MLVRQLGIFNGDAVLLKGKKRRDTVCIALVDEGLEDTNIRMSKVRYPQWTTTVVVGGMVGACAHRGTSRRSCRAFLLVHSFHLPRLGYCPTWRAQRLLIPCDLTDTELMLPVGKSRYEVKS